MSSLLLNDEVLVVDDEVQILQAIEDLLEDQCIVHTANSANAGLDILEAHPDIAVILSDQRMPEVDGATFLSRARRISAAVRILVTGYADLEAIIRAVNDGKIFACLSKPWDPHELLGVVKEALDQHSVEERH